MKKAILLSATMAMGVFIYSCGGSSTEQGSGQVNQETQETTTDIGDKGIGKFTEVELTHPLNEEWVAQGQNISDLKCLSCHKLTGERIVGPGWKGVTERRTPEWIMNFITNTDEMLSKDPESQAMLEICMVRMPNQNLSDEDARAVLEYMRKNDEMN